ncbi:MAG: HTTM domain-containing protein [Proteobacteria bacterium]|nr:HTTM domain-containing protein [Pseudomonadota bacterium]
MNIKNKITKKVNESLFISAPEKSLSVFRIALGLLTLIQCLLTLPYSASLYGRHGILDAELMSYISGWSLPMTSFFVSSGIDYRWIVYGVMIVQIVSAVSFLLGYRYYIACFGLWITNTIVMNSGEVSAYGVNRYLQLFSFMALFMPLNQVYTLRKDAIKVSHSQSQQSLWFLRLALGLTYFHAGIGKSFGLDWWTGDAVWRSLNLPEFNQFDLFWTGQYPLIYKILGWGTLFFEAFYVIGILFRKSRVLFVSSMILMHIGISLGLGLHFFALAMTIFNVTLFYSDILLIYNKRFGVQ